MKVRITRHFNSSKNTLRLRRLPITFHLQFDWEPYNFDYNGVKGVHQFSIYFAIFYWSIDIMFYESEKITITKEQFDSLQKKADKWDELEKKIGKFYYDDKTDEPIQEGDLGDIGEVAAVAFGFL